MSYLLEIVLSLFNLPSWNSRNDRSIVGESRLDKQTRFFGRLFYGVLALVVVGSLIWHFLLKT